jgi:tRNA-modifying protein YgfZ
MRTDTDLDWIDEHVRAFDEGHASAPVDARVVHVSGTDARRWLDDLVTAGVGSLADGAQARSLLLSPTGRIRADLHVVADGRAFLLVQAVDQPRPIRDLLGPYVLSSDVRLEDVPDARVHVLAADPDPRVVLDGDAGDDVPAGIFEVWRIRRGLARFPVDVDADSTPAEGGLDRLVDVTKGCFLGQEAVAKIRNLGHPARVTLGLFAPAGTTVGDEVTTQGRFVGTITSVAPARRGCDVIARVAWRDRDASLACPSGPLTSA